MSASEQIATSSKKVRGMAQASLDLIDAAAEAAQPEVVEKAERESLRHVLDRWKGVA